MSSIIFHLYNEHNILTYYGSNKDIPLKISPSLIVTVDDINYFFDCLDKTLSIGILKLVTNFVSSKFFNKFKF